jgi:LacI family transcriptional regulator
MSPVPAVASHRLCSPETAHEEATSMPEQITDSAAATQPAGAASASAAPEQPRVTIAQVAKLAGVSPTTVSHVLSGKRIVGAATRDAVQDAIRTLGYRPNHVARSLRTRRSQMVAVVVPDLTNTYYSVLTRGLADAIVGAAYGTYVCNTDGIAEREAGFLHDVVDRGADGIVLASVDDASVGARNAADFGTPVVCIGGSIDHPRVDVVTTDDVAGSYAATLHLIGRGSQRIGMIQGPPESGLLRVEGFLKAMAEAGRPVDDGMLARGDWTRQGGRDAMRALMSLPDPPDAVFCANDLTAIGAIDLARELGLSVPDDLAVVGYDDVDAATIVTPTLTTVRNPAYETGRKAGELLLSRLRGEYRDTGRTVVLECPLIPRESA